MNRTVFEEKPFGIDEDCCLAIKNIPEVELVTIGSMSVEYISEIYTFLSLIEFLLNITRALYILLN